MHMDLNDYDVSMKCNQKPQKTSYIHTPRISKGTSENPNEDNSHPSGSFMTTNVVTIPSQDTCNYKMTKSHN